MAPVRTLVRTYVPGLRQALVAPKRSPAWVGAMRKGLNGLNGEGWTVRDIRGRIQLTVRFEDGQRTSLVLDLPWAGTSQADLLSTAAKLKTLMLEKGLGLREAYGLLLGSQGMQTQAGDLNWQEVVHRFEAFKVGSGAVKPTNWHEMYRPVMQHVLTLLSAQPRPVNSRVLLERLVEAHGGAPGSRGRQLRMQYTAQLLRFAVNECAAHQRWEPPASLKPFVGIRGKGKELTTPIKDHQVVRLLAGIENAKWRNAVALVACFGLRGVELAYIQAQGDLLHCRYRKRTERCPEGTKPREIVGLDPDGLAGLSVNLLAQLAEQGNAALPESVTRPERAGQALGQFLGRQPIWRALVEETASTPSTDGAGQSLVPYSLRHGYALRAHEMYGHSPRATAALMGHSLKTHSDTYGAWTDREVIENVLERTRSVAARRAIEGCSAKHIFSAA
jgi:integrase